MAATTALEQFALELINRARLDPGGEFDRLIADAATGTGVTQSITNAIDFFNVDLALLANQFAALEGTFPLAYNANLRAAALGWTNEMIAADEQAHQLPGLPTLGTRVTDAGYSFQRVAENVFAFAQDAFHAHAGFFIDWGFGPGGIQSPPGHRNTIMNPLLVEVGIGFRSDLDPATDVGPLVTTQNFGNRFDYRAQIVGVVYDDDDLDDFYTPGEGTGGVSVGVTGPSGPSATSTALPGGYQLVADLAGVHTVSFSGAGLPNDVAVAVSLDGDNAKVDLVDGSTVLSSVDARIVSGATGLTLLGEDDIDGTGDGGANAIVGNAGRNRLSGGGGGRDSLSGGGDASADLLRGGGGNDVLEGGAGRDRLFGQNGNDVLDGGAGNDVHVGGSGRDTFVFTGRFGRDTIRDFDPDTDRIDLSGAAGSPGFGDLSFRTIGDDLSIGVGRDRILLLDVARSEIDAGDFIF